MVPAARDRAADCPLFGCMTCATACGPFMLSGGVPIEVVLDETSIAIGHPQGYADEGVAAATRPLAKYRCPGSLPSQSLINT
jgi:hypothetical protein